MRYLIIFVVGIGIFAGCVKYQGTTPSPSTASSCKPKGEIEVLTLQYRISVDAFAPSQFVARYPNGMTGGLRVDWKIGKEKKKELDAVLAQLEKDSVNGREFTAKAKWIHKGYELEVYEIEKKF